MLKPRMAVSFSRFDPPAVQMSRDNLLDGRGRGVTAARRAHRHHRGINRDRFLQRWSLLMITSFSSREACAVHFSVAFQTACNWFDGHSRPYGDVVDYAAQTLPEYNRVMRGVL